MIVLNGRLWIQKKIYTGCWKVFCPENFNSLLVTRDVDSGGKAKDLKHNSEKRSEVQECIYREKVKEKRKTWEKIQQKLPNVLKLNLIKIY